MRIGTLALAASALLLATTAASAGNHKAAAAPDLSGVVSGRQAGMMMSGAIMGNLKAAIDRGDEVKPLTFGARTLAGWAKAVPGMFPEGSNVPPTHAKPEVWSDWAGFKAKADAYAAATDKLVAAAQAGDKPGFAAAWTEVRGACGACHDAYKKAEEHH